jgi:hypothetical protein
VKYDIQPKAVLATCRENPTISRLIGFALSTHLVPPQNIATFSNGNPPSAMIYAQPFLFYFTRPAQLAAKASA